MRDDGIGPGIETSIAIDRPRIDAGDLVVVPVLLDEESGDAVRENAGASRHFFPI